MKINGRFVTDIELLAKAIGWAAVPGILRGTVRTWRKVTGGNDSIVAVDVHPTTVVNFLRELRTHSAEFEAKNIRIPFREDWFPPETWRELQGWDSAFCPDPSEHRSPSQWAVAGRRYAGGGDMHSLDLVADWERRLDDLALVWVLLPRSMVYDNPSFKDVMLQNIARGICYVYVIPDRDAREERIRQLAQELLGSVRKDNSPSREQIRSNIRCLRAHPELVVDLVDTSGVLMANPHSVVGSGYQIELSGGRAIGGILLSQNEIKSSYEQIKKYPLGNPSRPGKPVLGRDLQGLYEIAAKIAAREPITRRSPDHAPSFSFSEVDNLHMHVDVAANPAALEPVWEYLERTEGEWKLSTVSDSIEGPQAREIPHIYKEHNPAGKDATFDYFITIDLERYKDRSVSLDVVRGAEALRIAKEVALLVANLRDLTGVALEVEHVVGRILGDQDPAWLPEGEWFGSLDESAVGFPCAKAPDWRDIEIHHGFSCLKDGPDAPITLEDLRGFAKKHELKLGGLFVFYDGERWVYRTNCFVHSKEARQIAVKQHRQLAAFLQQKAKSLGQVEQKTIVERIVGIWNSTTLARDAALASARTSPRRVYR